MNTKEFNLKVSLANKHQRLKMKKTAILMPLIFLSGCGNGMLECNDSKAKDDVTEIIRSELENETSFSGFIQQRVKGNLSDLKISDIKTESHGENINLCSGIYSFSYKGKDIRETVKYKLSFLEDTKKTEVSILIYLANLAGDLGIRDAEASK